MSFDTTSPYRFAVAQTPESLALLSQAHALAAELGFPVMHKGGVLIIEHLLYGVKAHQCFIVPAAELTANIDNPTDRMAELFGVLRELRDTGGSTPAPALIFILTDDALQDARFEGVLAHLATIANATAYGSLENLREVLTPAFERTPAANALGDKLRPALTTAHSHRFPWMPPDPAFTQVLEGRDARNTADVSGLTDDQRDKLTVRFRRAHGPSRALRFDGDAVYLGWRQDSCAEDGMPLYACGSSERALVGVLLELTRMHATVQPKDVVCLENVLSLFDTTTQVRVLGLLREFVLATGVHLYLKEARDEIRSCARGLFEPHLFYADIVNVDPASPRP